VINGKPINNPIKNEPSIFTVKVAHGYVADSRFSLTANRRSEPTAAPTPASRPNCITDYLLVGFAGALFDLEAVAGEAVEVAAVEDAESDFVVAGVVEAGAVELVALFESELRESVR
jgi:hypothetical protein